MQALTVHSPNARLGLLEKNALFAHLDQIETLADGPEAAGFTPIAGIPPKMLVQAQKATNSWLEELGVPDDSEVLNTADATVARNAFAAVTFGTDLQGNIALTTAEQTAALLGVKSPRAFAHLEQMLTAYDWEFVERAKELRGYALTKILDETNNADPKIRLRALQMLGNVTEVGLFTERIEVKKVDASEEEINERLQQRIEQMRQLAQKLAPAASVEDVELKQLGDTA